MVRPRHVAEYAALRGALAAMALLPYGAALWWGEAAARILFVLGWRRAEAVRRIRQVLGAQAEAERIAAEALRNFLWSLVDAVYAPRWSAQWTRQHVQVEGEDHLREALAEGHGAILAVPHLGSWEMAGMLGPLIGYRLVSLVARQRNPLVDRYFVRWRGRRGVEVVPRGGMAVRRILRELAQGAVLAMPVDLRSPRAGVCVQFLGHAANLAEGLAFFAAAGKAPVLPCAVWRVARMDHVVRLWPPIHAAELRTRKDGAQWLLQSVLDALTPVILERPEQYFWFNRRWVLEPLEAEAGPAQSLSGTSAHAD